MRRKCRSLEKRLRLYDEVMRLRKQELRYKQTAKTIGKKSLDIVGKPAEMLHRDVRDLILRIC